MYIHSLPPFLGTPIQLVINADIYKQPITQQQVIRYVDMVKATCSSLKLSIRTGKKGDFRDFEGGMVVSSTWISLSILETSDLLGFTSTVNSMNYREQYQGWILVSFFCPPLNVIAWVSSVQQFKFIFCFCFPYLFISVFILGNFFLLKRYMPPCLHFLPTYLSSDRCFQQYNKSCYKAQII